jgi:hypothetical protein
MRLTLSDDEVLELIKILSRTNQFLYNSVLNQYNDATSRDISKKQLSIKQATKHRTDTAKAKINNAINLLRLEGKNITAYAIAKESGCSYNTVKKYYKVLNYEDR